jgi:hypothetical protein
VIEDDTLLGTGIREPGRPAGIGIKDFAVPVPGSSRYGSYSSSSSVRIGEAILCRLSRVPVSTRSETRRPTRNSSSSLLSIWASLSRCIQLLASSSGVFTGAAPTLPTAAGFETFFFITFPDDV